MKARRNVAGFTLIELLVVVAIIAVLIGILIPSLGAAREQAKKATCGSNMHAVAQGLSTYEADWGVFPCSYLYKGIPFNQQASASAANGYVHWSGLIYTPDNISKATGTDTTVNAQAAGRVPSKAFMCPSLEGGGLTPTNPGPSGQLEPGQTPENASLTDIQAPRCAYTANEAIIPRNKFPTGAGPNRPYRFVRLAEISRTSNTILLTEFTGKWQLIQGADDVTGGTNVVKSHRPVSGFIGNNGSEVDLYTIAAGAGFAGGGRGAFYGLRHVTAADIAGGGVTEPSTAQTRMEWIGHNHGLSNYAGRTTNFAYCDGHVESKTVLKTLIPFEWGDKVYSLRPGDDIAP